LSQSRRLIESEIVGTVLVVRLTQSSIADMSAVEDLDWQLKELADAEPGRNWVLDFSAVEFMLSRAINTLLVVLKRVRTQGADIHLCGLNERIREIFQVMRLDQIFRIHDSYQAALAAAQA